MTPARMIDGMFSRLGGGILVTLLMLGLAGCEQVTDDETAPASQITETEEADGEEASEGSEKTADGGEEDARQRDLAIALEAAANQANSLTTLALAIVGGSIIMLLQTSYLRPRKRHLRAAYLLFVPGWYFLGRSIYIGSEARGVYLAKLFSTKSPDLKLIQTINNDLVAQSDNLRMGLLMFAVWLGLYLAWWIYTDEPTGGD